MTLIQGTFGTSSIELRECGNREYHRCLYSESWPRVRSGMEVAIIRNLWDNLVHEAPVKSEMTPKFSFSSNRFQPHRISLQDLWRSSRPLAKRLLYTDAEEGACGSSSHVVMITVWATIK